MKKRFYIYMYVIAIAIILGGYVFHYIQIDSNAAKVNLVGSDFLNSYLENNKDSVISKYQINNQLQSSTDALKDLVDKTGDLAVLDRNLTKSEKKLLEQNHFVTTPFARTFYVLIANPQSKLSNLKISEIKNLLGSKVVSYNEIDPTIKDGKIEMIVPGSNLEYLNNFFTSNFTLDKDNINYEQDKLYLETLDSKIATSKYNSIESIVNAVATNKNAIAIVPFTKVAQNDSVKMLGIENHKLDTDNLLDTTYPYKLDISLIYRDDDGNKHITSAKQLVEIITTDEYKKLLLQPTKSNYLVPIK